MKFVSKVLCLAGAVVALTLGMVRANAYTLTYNGLNYGQSVSISYGTTSTSVFAGQINMSFTGGTPSGYATTFNAYCVELENYLQSPMEVALRSSDDLTRNSISPNSGKKASWLFNTYAGGVNSNTTGAALQIAIWEALYDSSTDLSGGYFKLLTNDSTLTSQVNTYLNALQTNYSATTATWFQATNPASSQDLIGAASTTPSGSAVPEPGIVSLLAGSSLSEIGRAHV